MKLPAFLAAFCLALAAMVAPPASPAARAEDVTFDIFYNSLADEGDWYNTPDYGYVWQPYVAYKNDTWRPYTDGYWAQTDAGWTWVSYENFGWAAYHYGRWTQLEGTGWVWVPGYEWGPGWVSWRQNDSYVGWAPIPPKHNRVAVQQVDVGVEPEPARRAPAVVHEPRGVVTYDELEEDYDTGYNASVDVTYDIGPSHYCFVPVASFGAPYVREVIVAPEENFVIISNTYNVTDICYRRGPRDGLFIYGGGPDFGFISQRVQRPIPRLFLDRRTDIGLVGFRQPGFSPLSVVRGDRLQVVGPTIARREFRLNDIKPPRVRETIAQPRLVNGWNGIQQRDPAAAQRLRAQYRQEAQVARPAREVVNRLPGPADFKPGAPPPQPLPPPPQARFAREQQGLRQPGGAAGPVPQPGLRQPGGAAGLVPQPGAIGQPAAANGLQPVNPAGRGVQNAADREARRNQQLQQMNERRAARGEAPLQPGAAAADRATRQQQQREAQQAAQQQRQQEATQKRATQQAAQQQRQQAAAQQREQQQQQAEQRRQQQQTAAQERAARQSEQRQANRPEGGGPGAEARRAQAAEANRARQEQAAQERNARQEQRRQQQEGAAAQPRANASERGAQAAERQQAQQQANAERRNANAEARQAQQAERRQQQEAQRGAGAEARQQQAAQVRAAAEARQQQAGQQRAAQAEARAAAQQQQRAQRQQAQPPQPQPQQRREQPAPAEGGDKKKRPPEGQ